MAGTTAMHNWWHTLTDAERGDWCEIVTGEADITDHMAADIDESYLGAADLTDGYNWRPAWDRYWLMNDVGRTDRWILSPQLQRFLEEQCDLL